MKFNEYQEQAVSLAIYPKEHSIIYPVLGLTGEAGEVADKIKKVLRDKEGEFSTAITRLELAKELGDVLWYLAALSEDLGFTLQQIAEMNLEKLFDRMERDKLKGDGDNR